MKGSPMQRNFGIGTAGGVLGAIAGKFKKNKQDAVVSEASDTRSAVAMKEPMKMKSPMELKEKSPAELEKDSAMDMKSPVEMKSPAELESPAKDYSTERGSHDHPHAAAKMKSPMEAEHGDSPAELESPAKSVRYFGMNTSPKEMKEVTDHNKKFHPSSGETKEGHKDHA